MTRRMLLAAAVLLYPFAGLAAAEETVSIAPFRDDKAAAVSYTFDDGLRKQVTVAVPLLREFGITATFFVIPGKVSATVEEAVARKGEWGGVTWDELRALDRQGFEIGNHTWTHQSLIKIDEAAVEEQIAKGHDAIAKEIGTAPISFCYPYNAHTDRIREIALRSHLACRDFQEGIGKKDVTPERVNAWIDRLIRERKWGVAMIHGLEEGFDALDPVMVRAHLAYAKQHDDALWIDTFGTVSRYRLERDSAHLEVAASTAQGITFTITAAPLNYGVPFVPLTIAVRAPGAIAATAERAGKPLPTTVRDGKVLIACIPDAAPVMVAWKTASR